MYSRSLSVWKQNWVFTQARLRAGTYSSQMAGGSTTWLSQSKTGKSLRARVAMVPPGFQPFAEGNGGLLSGNRGRSVNQADRVLRRARAPPGLPMEVTAAGLARFSLAGRVALVTGATRGLGLEG